MPTVIQGCGLLILGRKQGTGCRIPEPERLIGSDVRVVRLTKALSLSGLVLRCCNKLLNLSEFKKLVYIVIVPQSP